MTPDAPRPGLADALLLHAAGLTSDTAAAELICAHQTWLTRAEFVTGYIDAGTRHDGHPYAYIDWERAVTALDTRNLCCSPSGAPSTTPTSAWSPPPSPAPTADHDNPATTATTRAPPGPAGPAGGAFPLTSHAHPPRRRPAQPARRGTRRVSR